MPLLCALGLHRLHPIAHWNGGYYFTRCIRCRRDFVRGLSGPWLEPRESLVVWKSLETRPQVAAHSVGLPEVAEGGSGAAVPMTLDTRHLAEADALLPAVTPGPEHPPVRTGLWDERFMADDDDEKWWEEPAGNPARRSAVLPSASRRTVGR